MAANSFRFDIVDHVMLVVHANMPPDDEEWARMTLVRNAQRGKIRSLLVISAPNATLSAAQRADVAQFMSSTGTSGAIVTDSALIRGVARAVGFLGVKVQAFSTSEMTAALQYSLVPQARRPDILHRIEAMQAQLRSHLSPGSRPSRRPEARADSVASRSPRRTSAPR